MCQGLFFNKPEVNNFTKKETLARVYSCEFCKISKTTFSYRTPPVGASAFREMLKTQFSWNGNL